MHDGSLSSMIGGDSGELGRSIRLALIGYRMPHAPNGPFGATCTDGHTMPSSIQLSNESLDARIRMLHVSP